MKRKEPQTAAQPASLTDPQAAILGFIRERCRAGSSPSFREIQHHFGYKAVGTVQDHVRALVRKGHLEPSAGPGRRARSLVPSGRRPVPARELPIFGEIAAGSARDSVQLEIGSLLVAPDAVREPAFALRVVGNSMIGVGIFEGDFLIVERTPVAKSGDIVVALLNGETTVKRYQEKRGEIFLVPENPAMKPIPVTGESFSIQGRVVGLQRRL
jgi:repressor LexA